MSILAPVKVGDVLADKFRVDKIVGAGGMGVVVEATHLSLHQRVALKFLNEQAAQVPQVLARFEREARAAASLRSKHAVRIMDVGTMADSQPYIVMELLDGQDLASVIRSGAPLGVETAIEYIRQACDAVGEAHDRGIVHRDLKPGNLFVTTDNHGAPLVKVLDFGISKIAGDDLALTETSQLLGSPLYMSPEQLRASRDVDARTDVWSLGVILYEMLAGKVPFAAESIMELLLKIVESTPEPIASLRSDVPPYVLRAVEGCLVKERAQRIGSIAELLTMLKPDAPAVWPSASLASTSDRERSVVASAVTVREGRAPESPSSSSGADVGASDLQVAEARSGGASGASTNGGISGPVSGTQGRIASPRLVLLAGAAIAVVSVAGWVAMRSGAPEPTVGLVSSGGNGAPSAASVSGLVAPPSAVEPSAAPTSAWREPSAVASVAPVPSGARPAGTATVTAAGTATASSPSARPPTTKAAPDCNPPIYYDPVTGQKKVKPGC